MTWMREQTCKTDDAIRAIVAAKKTRVSEYDERLRKLKSYAEILFVKRSEPMNGELFSPEELLAPDLAKLLESPLRGLD